MAFTLQAIVDSTTVTLTNGSPFKLLSATGMGGTPVRRVVARGPAQQGDTDLGYRLQAREIELEIGFAASSDSVLDGYRDTLTSVFKPTASTPVNLRVTRDDGEVRQLDCYTVGQLQIDLVPDHRPGHYHVATVQLRASNPAWYDITPGTVSVSGTPDVNADWYLAGGAIGSANVLMYGTAPAQGEAWSYAGTLGTGDAWTLAFRMGLPATDNDNLIVAFSAENDGTASDFEFNQSPGGGYRSFAEMDVLSPSSGTHTFYLRHSPTETEKRAPRYYLASQDRTVYTSYEPSIIQTSLPINGTARTWRMSDSVGTSSAWPEEIDYYALYDISLSEAQMVALHKYMVGLIGGTIAQVLPVAYGGDVPEYPTIRITGPVHSPSITNTTTGHTLSFGTTQIAAGSVYAIDTRYGYKSVTQGTVNKRSELSADSDLGDWHLAPGPVAPGGTNVLALAGSNISTATTMQIVYRNRYLSF